MTLLHQSAHLVRQESRVCSGKQALGAAVSPAAHYDHLRVTSCNQARLVGADHGNSALG